MAANPNSPFAIAGGTSFNLGNIFNTASAQSGISLEFTTFGNNRVYNGVVRFQAGVPGDYNGNGIVDAADYTVWRDHFGQTFALPNEDPGSTARLGNDCGLHLLEGALWSIRKRRGQPGRGLVPEPGTAWMLVIGIVSLAHACWPSLSQGSALSIVGEFKLGHMVIESRMNSWRWTQVTEQNK